MSDVSVRTFYRRQNKLPVKRMLVGMFLLLSPSINLFDLLPDFIGCTLILSAIFDAAEVLPYFGDLREKLKTYFWVSLSRYPALFAMMSIYAGDSSQRSIVTVFAASSIDLSPIPSCATASIFARSQTRFAAAKAALRPASLDAKDDAAVAPSATVVKPTPESSNTPLTDVNSIESASSSATGANGTEPGFSPTTVSFRPPQLTVTEPGSLQ